MPATMGGKNGWPSPFGRLACNEAAGAGGEESVGLREGSIDPAGDEEKGDKPTEYKAASEAKTPFLFLEVTIQVT